MPMERIISVAVVIPTLKRYGLLKESLDSISSQSYIPDEVIVVDNCVDKYSYDPFIGRFSGKLNLRFLQQPKESIPCARNQGAEAAKSDILIFTDDDCLFDKEWIKNLIAPFLGDPEIGITGGEILTEAYSNSLVDNYFVDMKMSRVGIINGSKWKRGYAPGKITINRGFAIHPFFTGANMAVRREVFRAIGGFDADFRSNEDLEFCIRAVKNGWKLYFEPKAIVTHKPPRRLKQIFCSWFNYGLYHAPLFRKHNNGKIEIYIYKSWKISSAVYPNFLIFMAKAPFNAVIFINSFHLMNMSLFLAIISGIMSYNELSWICLSLFFIFGLRYLWPRIITLRRPGLFFYLGINYLLNLSYTLGTFIGGLKNGMLYIEATVDEAR